MVDYAIDEEFHNIFKKIEVDEKDIRNFLISFHKLLQKKDELTKELATKADIIEVKSEINEVSSKVDRVKIELKSEINEVKIELKKDVEVLSNKFDSKFDTVDRRFKQMDRQFEQMDKRFESVDKKFDSMILRMDRFMFWSLGLTITSTLFIIGFIFKFFGN